MRAIARLVMPLPADEVVVSVDEVDIHLNPEVGPDRTKRGRQEEVVTPGCNPKRHLAGAWDPKARRLIYVEGGRKNSLLSLQLLHEPAMKSSPNAERSHVILDNHGLHDSARVRLAMRSEAAARLGLHFLPPCCPDHDRIERILEGPSRQRHAEPPLRDDGGAHGRGAEFPGVPKSMQASHVCPNENGLTRRAPKSGNADLGRRTTRRLLVAALTRSHNLPVVEGYPAGPVTFDWARAAMPDPIAYFIEHRDDFRTTLFLLAIRDFNYAGLNGETGEITSCQMYLPMPGHGSTIADFFNPLCHHIERMVIEGRAAYPVERTLLTSGMVIGGVQSLHKGGALVETPEMAVRNSVPDESYFWRA